MPIIMEAGMEYEVSEYEKELLQRTGFIVSSSDGPWYDTTSLLWEEYRIEGVKLFRMFDLLLDRKESRFVDTRGSEGT